MLIYGRISEYDLEIVFWTFLISKTSHQLYFKVDILLFFLYYPLGFYSVWKRSYKLIDNFALISIIGLLI
jgi:hypothetical protein